MRVVKGIDYQKNDELECYKQTIKEIKKGKKSYVYNEKILELIKQEYPNIEIKKKDFYWEVKNDV